MTLRNIAAASLAALALAACGDDDDDNNTKPITPDTPATPEACKAMKCVYQTEGDFKGSFVAKNEKGQITAVWDAKGNQTHKLGKDGKLQKIETPDDGKKPGTAGEFDLSGEGVTEPLKEPVRGGSNYVRGTKATFDIVANKASISSIATYGFDEGHWNEAMDNFVAIDPNKAKEKGLTRALFENIDTYNKDTAGHANGAVFPDFGSGGAKNQNIINNDGATPAVVGKLEDYSRDLPSTIEMKITDKVALGKDKLFMANGSLTYGDRDYENGKDEQAWAQEEQDLDGSTRLMNGGKASRLYGAKVWGAEPRNITRIANFDGVESVLPNVGDKQGIADGATLPTAVAYDQLENVQFGRLSGIAEKEGLHPAHNKYEDPNLQGIDFAKKISNSVVLSGQAKATDFYFSRGNHPTPLDKMKALKSGTITYHGQALTYGVDNSYHGPQSKKDEAESKGSVPNSVKGTNQGENKTTLLGGRGNFVVAQFAPDQGKVHGSVYNVWNIADISPAYDASKKLVGFYQLKKAGPNAEFEKGTVTTCTAAEHCVTQLDATAYANVHGYKDNLISFSGAVNGNKIEGDAYRYDGEEGKFAGAFFGDGATEMAGVISSAVKYGQQPNDKWGAVFGAKTLKGPESGKDVPSIPTGSKPLGWSLERK